MKTLLKIQLGNVMFLLCLGEVKTHFSIRERLRQLDIVSFAQDVCSWYAVSETNGCTASPVLCLQAVRWRQQCAVPSFTIAKCQFWWWNVKLWFDVKTKGLCLLNNNNTNATSESLYIGECYYSFYQQQQLTENRKVFPFITQLAITTMWKGKENRWHSFLHKSGMEHSNQTDRAQLIASFHLEAINNITNYTPWKIFITYWLKCEALGKETNSIGNSSLWLLMQFGPLVSQEQLWTFITEFPCSCPATCLWPLVAKTLS